MRNHRLIFFLGLALSLMVALVLGVKSQPDRRLTAHAEEGAAPEASSITAPVTDTLAANDLIPRAYLPLLLKPVPPVYLPLVFKPLGALDSPLPPPILVTGTQPIDFEAVRTDLQANGQDLEFVKIGFHTGLNSVATGLSDALIALDAAGVPFFIKSVDTAGFLPEAQALAQSSDVPHTLVYRRSGNSYDTPNYLLDPEIAAAQHWALHVAAWPPELDKNLVWIETINEVDKNRSEWLAEFALETAALALQDGRRWAAFGWSSGEPEVVEPKHWEGPMMLEFLRLAGEHPDQIAIALHEYSYTVSDIANAYPYLVGRFQFLFEVCDAHNIPRPTVLITEWGWEYQDVPDVSRAMDDITWASWLYAAYPQVQGAAIWYLGDGFGGIAYQAQQLISPVREYALTHYYIVEQGQGGVEAELFRP